MGQIIKAHPKMLKMRATRYVNLYQEGIVLAKIWYNQFVPVDERKTTNEYITEEFARRGMI